MSRKSFCLPCPDHDISDPMYRLLIRKLPVENHSIAVFLAHVRRHATFTVHMDDSAPNLFVLISSFH
jgi:hypothetical protein